MAPKILKLKTSGHWGKPTSGRYNVQSLCVWAKPTGKVGLIKAKGN